MQVVAHHGVGVDGDGEALREQLQALFDPVLAVLEGLAGVTINAAQEGTAHAALYAMKGAGAAGSDE